MRVIHVFRSPVGGLFRHVRDLVRGQKALGHSCGVVCDSLTGSTSAEAALSDMAKNCDLGIKRVPMPRQPHWRDVPNLRLIQEHIAPLKPDVIHTHGAKGGFYGRIVAKRMGIPSLYTPHRGSLHYTWGTPQGIMFLGVEKMLTYKGSGYVFVCKYERDVFEQKIGRSGRPYIVAYNGLWDEEFEDVGLAADATDLLFVGEMRQIKGVDLLLEAIKIANPKRRITLTLVGDGPHLPEFQADCHRLGLDAQVRFAGRMPMREALTKGRLVVFPSRDESFPYVVVEAAAAAVPMLATAVGGIPEVLPPSMMFKSLEPPHIAEMLLEKLDSLPNLRTAALDLREAVRGKLDAAEMSSQICSFYKVLCENGSPR